MNLITALNFMIGTKLSAIEFVWDYIQLKFDDEILTLLVPPQVGIGGVFYEWDHFGFKDMLCQLIGNRLESAEVNSKLIKLFFENKSEVVIFFSDEDRVEPEAFEFRSSRGNWVG